MGGPNQISSHARGGVSLDGNPRFAWAQSMDSAMRLGLPNFGLSWGVVLEDSTEPCPGRIVRAYKQLFFGAEAFDTRQQAPMK